MKLETSAIATLVLCTLVGITIQTNAQVTVGVDPSANWLGYMNVSNLPEDGGAYQYGTAWGTEDLTAVFTPGVLTLGPNTIDDPADYWYKGGGGPGAPGNKIMEANMYVEETGSLAGIELTFTGTVLANTLTDAHTSVAFIKDFAPDYSSFEIVTTPLPPGPFSISLNTIDDSSRHVQYGFTTTGVNVWPTDVAPYGTVQIGTLVPEPSIFALAGLGVAALLIGRKRQ